MRGRKTVADARRVLVGLCTAFTVIALLATTAAAQAP
jgi:hypothetical protein